MLLQVFQGLDLGGSRGGRAPRVAHGQGPRPRRHGSGNIASPPSLGRPSGVPCDPTTRAQGVPLLFLTSEQHLIVNFTLQRVSRRGLSTRTHSSQAASICYMLPLLVRH
ncbi:hypothetical protein HBH98_095400 [Parastagonospora nodorum]|nr:hypothetical protein HBH52_201810 [Parastagonospora nodorum]KAH4347588.1 hypothetical protein HBH98_095400 [Parastagonospora nodorum]KAH4378598.1 hypothetical protein HBH99_202770 [Parastagonospora nodorum]KAH4388705.1 hypothetical protein HBH97_051970 [Parastagonospora nodorum]KAH5036031.1 hypothetical protein HBI75_082420 [Parastagonospora nodorum]